MQYALKSDAPHDITQLHIPSWHTFTNTIVWVVATVSACLPNVQTQYCIGLHYYNAQQTASSVCIVFVVNWNNEHC